MSMLATSEVLAELPAMLERIARDVKRSKAKDDERGLRIIDDYADAHGTAEGDLCVVQTHVETRRLQAEVGELIARLESSQPLEPVASVRQPCAV